MATDPETPDQPPHAALPADAAAAASTAPGDADPQAPHGRCRYENCRRPLPAPRATGRRPEFCRPPRNCRSAYHAAAKKRLDRRVADVRRNTETVTAEAAPQMLALADLLRGVHGELTALGAAIADRTGYDSYVQGLLDDTEEAEQRATDAEDQAVKARRAAGEALQRAEEAERRAERAEQAAADQIAAHQRALDIALQRADEAHGRADAAVGQLERERRTHQAALAAATAQLDQAAADNTRLVRELATSQQATASARDQATEQRARAQAASEELTSARSALTEARDKLAQAERAGEALTLDLQAAHTTVAELTAAADDARRKLAASREQAARHDGVLAEVRRQATGLQHQLHDALARAVRAEASAKVPLPPGLHVPDLADVDGLPGVDLGSSRFVLVEHGHVVPARLPEEPLDPDTAAAIGLALLTAAAAARDSSPTT